MGSQSVLHEGVCVRACVCVCARAPVCVCVCVCVYVCVFRGSFRKMSKGGQYITFKKLGAGGGGGG